MARRVALIEWTDAEKDEPLEEGLYLVCRGNAGHVNVAVWNGRSWEHPHVIDDMRDITYWAELPPPPEKKARKT